MSSPGDSGGSTPPDPGPVVSFDPAVAAQSVTDALRDTAFAPLLDSPVADVLQTLGLPALPQLPALPPLPELPPLPTLDLTALTKPLTDLASAFGSGQLGSGLDASSMLSGVSTALQQIMSIASTLASLASSDQWSGTGATSAAEKGSQAQTDAVELQTQNLQQKTVLAGAATTVGTGAAAMSAVITKFVTGVTVSAPFLGTPPGQAFLLSLASETAAEATAVVAKTRAELTVHSANMTAAGKKVKVTEPPTGVKSTADLSSLLSMIQPLTSVASTGVQTVQQLSSISQPIDAQPAESTEPVAPEDVPMSAFGGGGAAPGGVAIGGGFTGTTSLSQNTSTRTMSATATPPGPVPTPAPGSGTTAMSSGMVPPMAAAGAAARAGDGGDEEIRTHLVTAEYGDEVVGELGNTGVPVVGATGNTGPRPAV